MAEGAKLYLEDLHVGLRFDCGAHALDAAQIKAFAREYDPQPFHLDEEAARGTFFGGLAASGWHVVCLAMRAIADHVPMAGGLIGGGAEISWPQPTRPDDILHVTSEIMEVTPSRSKPERGMALLRTETRNQRGELLQVFTAKCVVPRRPK
ncbi:MAG TPA: MaoC family dehydratase [Alphaproteobacteria bacterium]|nr:MaoC family dehydratase [Alphaproteobacteria bacterium]